MDRFTITCVIHCTSVETLRKLEQSAKRRIDLNDTIVRTWQSFPDGAEERTVKRYRLGDYFDRIDCLPGDDALSFKLVFHPRQGVSSYWKDLLMAVVHSIADGMAGVSATVGYS